MTPTSEATGFVSHRPEFKSRPYPCWLCDLGQGTSPLGCSVYTGGELATVERRVVWAEHKPVLHKLLSSLFPSL